MGTLCVTTVKFKYWDLWPYDETIKRTLPRWRKSVNQSLPHAEVHAGAALIRTFHLHKMYKFRLENLTEILLNQICHFVNFFEWHVNWWIIWSSPVWRQVEDHDWPTLPRRLKSNLLKRTRPIDLWTTRSVSPNPSISRNWPPFSPSSAACSDWAVRWRKRPPPLVPSRRLPFRPPAPCPSFSPDAVPPLRHNIRRVLPVDNLSLCLSREASLPSNNLTNCLHIQTIIGKYCFLYIAWYRSSTITAPSSEFI